MFDYTEQITCLSASDYCLFIFSCWELNIARVLASLRMKKKFEVNDFQDERPFGCAASH